MDKENQKIKKQHYVARSILERFTVDGEKLFAYDKFSQKSFPANKKDIAHENYFYDIPAELLTEEFKQMGVEQQAIEKYLSKIDGDFNRAIQEVINLPKKGKLSDELKENLAYGLTYQIFRTKEFRNLIIEGHRKLRQAISDDLVKINFPDADKGLYPKVELKSGHEPVLHMQYLVDPNFVATMVEILYSHIWLIGVNQTVNVFYTSDNPVVKHHHIKNPAQTGWKSPGVEIVFPLTPRLILTLCDRVVFKNYEKYEGKKRPFYRENVTYYNSLQVIHSYRQLYCPVNEFTLAEDMCSKQPSLTRPSENRVDVTMVDNLLGFHFLG